jgi:hypothetical protein
MVFSSAQFRGEHGFYIAHLDIVKETEWAIFFRHGKSKAVLQIARADIIQGPHIDEGDKDSDWPGGADTWMIIQRDVAQYLCKQQRQLSTPKAKQEKKEKSTWLKTEEGKLWIQSKKDAGTWMS